MRKIRRGLFFRLKDYNYILDKILEEKNFSEDAKNLLLSMVYKIESSYADYSQIKGIYQKKNDFMDEIINTVSTHCKYLFLVDPKNEEVKMLKQNKVLALTNEKEQRIYAYPTELAVLYGICDIKPKYFYIPKGYYYIKNRFQSLLVEGTILNNTEVIRNFNGWSWNYQEDSQINQVPNMIYQSIRLLLGEDFLREWENDSSGKIDYIYELRKDLFMEYGKEAARDFYINLTRLIIATNSREGKEKLKKEYEKVLEAYNNMGDKTEYIYKVSNEKKKLTSDIQKIDLLLSNGEALKKEFVKRNNKLPLDKQLFSVGNLADILENEKARYMKRMKELNELVKPNNFTQMKNELAEKMHIMSAVVDNKTIREYSIDFQKAVLKCFNVLVENANTKQEIIDLIYKMRYYKKIRITENEKTEDISYLQVQINKIMQTLVVKACKEKVFNIFCKDIAFNYKIILKALETAIPDYDNVDIELKLEGEILKIVVYDNEIADLETEIEFPIPAKDLAVRQKKKVPLYMF